MVFSIGIYNAGTFLTSGKSGQMPWKPWLFGSPPSDSAAPSMGCLELA